jgi:hypothetical protein
MRPCQLASGPDGRVVTLLRPSAKRHAVVNASTQHIHVPRAMDQTASRVDAARMDQRQLATAPTGARIAGDQDVLEAVLGCQRLKNELGAEVVEAVSEDTICRCDHEEMATSSTAAGQFFSAERS